MYVSSTICPNLTVDYKKEERSEFIKKRPHSDSGSTNSEEKRMRVTLDNTEAENRSMRERLQKVRTSPQLAILHNSLASQEEQFAEREKQLLARIAALEADKRKKVKEAAAMRSLLEQTDLAAFSCRGWNCWPELKKEALLQSASVVSKILPPEYTK